MEGIRLVQLILAPVGDTRTERLFFMSSDVPGIEVLEQQIKLQHIAQATTVCCVPGVWHGASVACMWGENIPRGT